MFKRVLLWSKNRLLYIFHLLPSLGFIYIKINFGFPYMFVCQIEYLKTLLKYPMKHIYGLNVVIILNCQILYIYFLTSRCPRAKYDLIFRKEVIVIFFLLKIFFQKVINLLICCSWITCSSFVVNKTMNSSVLVFSVLPFLSICIVLYMRISAKGDLF